ncbi:MAG: DASS family sodium-coupled anion symporter [Oligoflexia bacterium]|nr:DASS family sodium-coupled anion symporter [Oligoflexia bacterium]
MKLNPRTIGIFLAALAFLVPWFFQIEGLTPAGHRMLGIFLMAIILWISEAVPMHATASLIIFLMVMLLGKEAPSFAVAGLGDFKLLAAKEVFATLADPVIILFLGGFFLADGATKFQLDKSLSRVVLKPFGVRPRMVLMGMMLITAVFSMFMSNTATTATMMAVVLPVIAQFGAGDRMRAAFALAIPVAANIGGIGTPIGTPPNAIALGALSASLGKSPITFMQWMMGAVPFMLVFLAFAWGLLVWLFPTKQKEMRLEMTAKFDLSRDAVIFYLTFAVTVLLWMTESLHGVSSNVVGFLPVVILLCTKVFSVKDLQSLDWHVLWLVAGGIALGLGIQKTQMGEWFVQLFPWSEMSPFLLVAVLTGAALTVGTFISHSATTNLLVPLAITMAKGIPTLSQVEAAVFVAIGSSLAMSLPISTPPNAIAFATGEVKTRDMAIVGSIFGIVSWVLFVTFGPWFWRLLGIL